MGQTGGKSRRRLHGNHFHASLFCMNFENVIVDKQEYYEVRSNIQITKKCGPTSKFLIYGYIDIPHLILNKQGDWKK